MEDDHDELLQVTDDDSSGTEDQDIDQCISNDTQDEEQGSHADNCRFPLINCNYSKCEFITTKVALIFSSTSLIILLPAYLDSVNTQSDAYNLILMNSSFTVMALVLCFIIGKFVFNTYKNMKITDCPLRLSRIFILSVLYTASGFLIVYAVDRKRVMCHLQDPIKGCILIFSLLYYFIFCRKLMGLQRIFSATTIIVGLFIAVDYGLCDEFRCRGYERVHVADDTGNWSWRTHSTWIAIYVLGLALFSAYFTLLERYLLVSESNALITLNVTPSFLTTISRSIAFPVVENGHNVIRTNHVNVEHHDKSSSVHVALSLHIVGWMIVVLSFWTDMIPSIGKGSTFSDFFNFTSNGIMCHFRTQLFQTQELSGCGNTFLFSWLFLGCYVLFSVVSIKFMMMSQSAVYTIATISSSLPLVGIWWSLFKLYPLQNGVSVILWSPSISGELICSLLGLPIVLLGLFLFCKSHFRDINWPGISSNYITMPSHFA